jgi:hypothetical protein
MDALHKDGGKKQTLFKWCNVIMTCVKKCHVSKFLVKIVKKGHKMQKGQISGSKIAHLKVERPKSHNW